MCTSQFGGQKCIWGALPRKGRRGYGLADATESFKVSLDCFTKLLNKITCVVLYCAVC